MNGLWYINGADLHASYGSYITKGSYLTIMSPPKPRRRREYEYHDETGMKVDDESILSYEPYRYTIKVLVTGSSLSGFWANLNGLIAAIATPEEFTLSITDLGITCNLFYEGARCISKKGSMSNGGAMAIYEISVLEKDPTTRY
ncbi:MAG: hypothetical protein RBT57_02865 [Paludibacter sp.]|jgi:hypothetical protein|nr:hypothetical protein [Paludibacter sp.]